MGSSIFIAINAGGRWQLGIGDPTIIGWVTVVAYFGAAFLCLRAWSAGRMQIRQFSGVSDRAAQGQHQITRFWFGLFMVMVLLGINKQLDLQGLVTEIGRELAIAQGWYATRRIVQVIFIAFLGVFGALLALTIAFVMRRVVRRILLALVGILALSMYIVIRAASFHHVDILLSSDTGRFGWVLELLGIGIIALAALRPSAAVTA